MEAGMLELYFFILGLLNSLMLITVFLIRRKRLVFLQRYGWTYLLLSVPAACGILLSLVEHKPIQYSIFLVLFLIYLFLEWLLDYVLKINFREDWKKNWKWMIPYLALYYSTNYGFIVMPWKTSLIWGVIMLILFVIQIIANLSSHPFTK